MILPSVWLRGAMEPQEQVSIVRASCTLVKRATQGHLVGIGATYHSANSLFVPVLLNKIMHGDGSKSSHA